MKKRVFFDSDSSFYTVIEDGDKIIVIYTYNYNSQNNTGKWIDAEGSRNEAAAWIRKIRRKKEC